MRILLAVYLVAIYSTLGAVRGVASSLRDAGLLRTSVLASFVIAGSAVLWLVFREGRYRNARVVLTLMVTVAVYALVILPMESAEEKIHFIQYGVVALLAVASAPKRFNNYLFAALFTLAAGWIDELIQWLLPTRYYDPRDVAFNAAAGLMALAALAAIRFSARETPAPAGRSDPSR